MASLRPRIAFAVTALLLAISLVPAESDAPLPKPSRPDLTPKVIGRAADQRVVAWYSSIIDGSGEPLVLANRWTEIATGLHGFVRGPVTFPSGRG